MINGDDLRYVLEQVEIVIDRSAVVGMGRRVSQVADVMRDNGTAFMQKAKRVFQLAPEC